MCGIIAYVGNNLCRHNILEGLSRLDYREYDSAGFVCIDAKHNHLSYHKEAGGVDPIKRLIDTVKFDGHVGMAHTRWATHGIVDQQNAHPHFNCKKSIAVIHNGIIEEYEELRQQLIEQGHDFNSTTDSEVVAHIFSTLLDHHKDPQKALIDLVKRIKGAYAFVFLIEQYPDKLFIVRHRSPMNIGIGNDEMFVASDLIAFSEKTKNVVFMPDDTFALISKDSIELHGFDGRTVPYYVQEIDQSYINVDKEGFEHYLLKEIYEQKRSINRTINFCKVIGNYTDAAIDEHISPLRATPTHNGYNDSIWRHIGLTSEKIANLEHINLVAAGTSLNAASIAQFFFETICNIPTRVYVSSEFCYLPFLPEANNIYIMISQSGETPDTLDALRLINSFEQHTVVLTNVASSTMVREASGFLPMQAGPEIAGSSTKAFSTQIATLYWLANRIALERGAITPEQMNESEEHLFVASEILEAAIDIHKFKIIKDIAPQFAQFDRFVFMGRHICYPFAMEAALKLKEIAHLFAQGYAAGELKHGPAEIINEKVPVIIFSALDDLIYQKIVSNAKEIKARNGRLLAFAFEGQDELANIADYSFTLPHVTPLLTPLAMTGLMQFFIYQISRHLGQPIDKPRHYSKPMVME
jgi:glutamine---fructose-6-phosphate transaminase (isomerizing)